MAYQTVLVEKGDGYGTITMNRPKANALSLALIGDLGAALEDLAEDAAVKVVLITGQGRFFSAGADVPTIQSMFSDPFAPGGLLAEGAKLMGVVERYPKPVVAVVNGMALGGGCELCLACHIRIAADTAAFGQQEITLGIVPGWGGTFRLPRLVGESRAAEWLMTGRTVMAEEALEAGLVCKVVPADDLLDAAKELAETLASRPVAAMRATLTALRERAYDTPRGMAVEADAFTEAAQSKGAPWKAWRRSSKNVRRSSRGNDTSTHDHQRQERPAGPSTVGRSGPPTVGRSAQGRPVDRGPVGGGPWVGPDRARLGAGWRRRLGARVQGRGGQGGHHPVRYPAVRGRTLGNAAERLRETPRAGRDRHP